MLKAVLLDLDNTLVLFNETEFYTGYFDRIMHYFDDLLLPEAFHQRLISATQALRGSNGRQSNADYFMDRFSRDLAAGRADLWQRFERFYQTDYDRLAVNYTLPAGIDDLFAYLAQLPLKRVIASNPVFPLNVQAKRMAWAGLAAADFDLVTGIENMSFVKPRTEYYLQICEMIATAPENCLMVGNDPVNDMVAGKTGMKTFLTVDGRDPDKSSLVLSQQFTKSAAGDTPAYDHQGPMLEVAAFVKNNL